MEQKLDDLLHQQCEINKLKQFQFTANELLSTLNKNEIYVIHKNDPRVESGDNSNNLQLFNKKDEYTLNEKVNEALKKLNDKKTGVIDKLLAVYYTESNLDFETYLYQSVKKDLFIESIRHELEKVQELKQIQFNINNLCKEFKSFLDDIAYYFNLIDDRIVCTVHDVNQIYIPNVCKLDKNITIFNLETNLLNVDIRFILLSINKTLEYRLTEKTEKIQKVKSKIFDLIIDTLD